MTVVFLFWQVVELLVDKVPKMFHELILQISTKSFVKSQVTLNKSLRQYVAKQSQYLHLYFFKIFFT